jgi:hypothetical protein
MRNPSNYAYIGAIMADALAKPIYAHTEPIQEPVGDIYLNIAQWATQFVDNAIYEECNDVADTAIIYATMKASEVYGLPFDSVLRCAQPYATANELLYSY